MASEGRGYKGPVAFVSGGVQQPASKKEGAVKEEGAEEEDEEGGSGYSSRFLKL